MSSYIYLALLVVIVAAEFIRPPALYYRGLYHDLDEDKDGIVSMTELGYLRDCLRLVISERKFDRTAFFVIDPIAYEKAPDDAVLDEHGSITREQLRRLLELLMPQIFTPHNFLRDSAWDEKGTRAKAINVSWCTVIEMFQHEPGYTKERQFNLTSEEARALNAETDLRNDLLSMVDFDENGYVSFYEFARYLRSLAPIHDHAYVLGRYMEHQSNGLMNEREMVICLRRLLGQCTNIFQSPSACHVLDATLNMVDEDENIPPQELINKMLDLHFAKYTGPNEDSVYEKEMESGKKHPHAHNH